MEARDVECALVTAAQNDWLFALKQTERKFPAGEAAERREPRQTARRLFSVHGDPEDPLESPF